MVSDFWVPFLVAAVVSGVFAVLVAAVGSSRQTVIIAAAIMFLLTFVVWGFLQWRQRWEFEEERNFEPPRTRIVELERPILLRTHAEPERVVKEAKDSEIAAKLPAFLDACYSVGTTVDALESAGYPRPLQAALKQKAADMGLMVKSSKGTWSLVEKPERDS